MTPYFQTSWLIDKLIGEAQRWIGTPFVAHSAIPGAGVDCVHLAAALYLETGALERFNPPPYSLDAGQHNEVSQVVAWIGASGRFEQLEPTAKPQSGDLLCFNLARTAHHCGILLSGERFIHAPFRRPVELASLTDPIYRRCLRVIFRPLAFQLKEAA